MADRVNYYNKLDFSMQYKPGSSSKPARKQSMYYFDTKEPLRYFPKGLRFDYIFGDVTWVPSTPSLVKSRPISTSNQNSILLKLNKMRHFTFHRDSMDFVDKKGMAVWRGGYSSNPQRAVLVDRYGGHRLCDVGRSRKGARAPEYLSPFQQMAYKYIISLEGNDVASNLKWIMASNSLCLMPRPRYETWFGEGLLEPGVHYGELRDDLDDLEDKIIYFEKNQGEAGEIIRNANSYVRKFGNEACERAISLLVLYKYFLLTGQIEGKDNIVAMLRAG